jgi:hypothetical protein
MVGISHQGGREYRVAVTIFFNFAIQISNHEFRIEFIISGIGTFVDAIFPLLLVVVLVQGRSLLLLRSSSSSSILSSPIRCQETSQTGMYRGRQGPWNTSQGSGGRNRSCQDNGQGRILHSRFNRNSTGCLITCLKHTTWNPISHGKSNGMQQDDR